MLAYCALIRRRNVTLLICHCHNKNVIEFGSGFIEFENGTLLLVESLPNATSIAVVTSSANDRIADAKGNFIPPWESMLDGDVDFINFDKSAVESGKGETTSNEPCQSTECKENATRATKSSWKGHGQYLEKVISPLVQ